MKKCLSLVLAFVLSMSLLAVPSMAVEDIPEETQGLDESVVLEEEDLATAEDVQDYYSTLASTAKSSKAIIVIPGIAGTALKKLPQNQLVWIWVTNFRYLGCDESGNSEYSISPTTEGGLWPGITYGVLNLYKPICTSLENEFGNEYDVVFFPYDWRMSNADTAELLSDFIDESNYSDVILVAHSMGGLVASKYIKSSTGQSKTEKMITLGTPYFGSPRSVYVMETGDMFGICKNSIKDLAKNFPAVYELMPQSKGFSDYIKKGSTVLSGYSKTTAFLKTLDWGKKSTGSAKTMFTTANSFNNTLYNGSTHIANSEKVPTYKIFGTGIETIQTVCYDSNGNYTGTVTTNTGDETVLITSARCGSTSKAYGIYNVGHLDLISNSDAIDKVISIINGTTRSTMDVGEEYTINERGWIEGLESSKLIKVSVAEEAVVTLYTADGVMVEESNERLYVVDGNGATKRLGSVWHNGSSKEYSLYDGDYELTINMAGAPEQSEVSVDYFDSGYYKRVIEYVNDGLYEVTKLSVSSFDKMEVTHKGVVPAAEVNFIENMEQMMQPVRVLEEEDLTDIEQGELRQK